MSVISIWPILLTEIPKCCERFGNNNNRQGGYMKIAVLGGDGYCGWATALYMSKKGHDVAIVDSFARRQWDFELGVQTLTPISPLPDRLRAWHEHTGKSIELFIGDVTDYEFLAATIKDISPDAVIHF